jgi:hypothetical protein
MGPHGECRVSVAESGGDDSDGNPPQVPYGAAGVASIVKTQLARTGSGEQSRPGEPQRLGVHR